MARIKQSQKETSKTQRPLHKSQNQIHNLTNVPYIDGQLNLSQQDIIYLQRTIGNHALVNLLNPPKTIQRYDVIEQNGTTYHRSENGIYIIDRSNISRIYVLKDAKPPIYCQALRTTIVIDGKTYVAHTPMGLFYADCLHTAEELMSRQRLIPHQDVHSQVAGTGRAFGVSEEDNKAVAAEFADKYGNAADDHAQASVGQALAIVEMGDERGASDFPYHAAAVVAQDGSDMITLEVEAGYKDASKRNTAGEFNMHNGNPTREKRGQTFHAKNAGEFNAPITITIEPIPKDN